METESQIVLQVEGLKQQLIDREKNEHFTVYVEKKLDFYSGDFIGLLGPSGCGKTTLLTVLGLLRAPSNFEEMQHFKLYVPSAAGEYELIDLQAAWQNRNRKLIEWLRRRHIGFALQSGELISSLTVRENIGFPLRLNHWPEKKIDQRVSQLLDQFALSRVKESVVTADAMTDLSIQSSNGTSGMEMAAADSQPENQLAGSRINRLSGGEYQRVSLARSISHFPSVVFVDEPTSALNRELANGALTVMHNLQQEVEHPGITFMITHDEYLAEKFCNVVVRMAPRHGESAGEVVDVVRKSKPVPIGSDSQKVAGQS